MFPTNDRCTAVPTPRIGGLGVMVGALPFAWAFATPELAVILGAAIFLCALSFADDVRSLPIEVRLAGHLVAAAIVVLAMQDGGEPVGANLVESMVAVLAIVWMTNLFNFMDGSDGLAGGMAAIGFGALAVAAATCGALRARSHRSRRLPRRSAGFLVHNFPPGARLHGRCRLRAAGLPRGRPGLRWMDERARGRCSSR